MPVIFMHRDMLINDCIISHVTWLYSELQCQTFATACLQQFSPVIVFNQSLVDNLTYNGRLLVVWYAELFENADATAIMDFIKDISFYQLV